MSRRAKLDANEARERVRRYIANMSAEYDALWQNYREVVRENALLHERLNRYERAACYRESEREAANLRQ